MGIEIEYMMHGYDDAFRNPDYDKWEVEVESYSIEQLNARLCEIHEAREENYQGELYLLLEVRKSKLDKSFEWTAENIKKFVQLNQQMMDKIQQLTVKGKSIVKEVEERISKDSFFVDFEAHAIISPKILRWEEESQSMCEPSDGIYCLLDEIFNNDCCLNINLKYPDRRKSDLNWNGMVGARNGELADHYICYAMHELYDHTEWSLQDIIQINALWCDIKVEYQHF